MAVFCSLLASCSMRKDSGNGEDVAAGEAGGGRTIDFFTQENIAWTDATRVRSKKCGLVHATPESPGKLWYEGSPGAREGYSCFSKPLPVGDCGQLILEYKAPPGTCFTVDTYWDTMPKEQLRPVSGVPGDGNWHQVAIPARGKFITIGCCISGNGEEGTGGLKEARVKPLRAVRRPLGAKVNPAWLEAPLLIPEPKECQLGGETIVLVKDGRGRFGVCLNANDLPLKKIIAAEIAAACGVKEQDARTGATLAELSGCDTIIDLRLNEGGAKTPGRKEGYAIECKPMGGKTTVILASDDKAGLYWAWQTLRQLMVKEGDAVSLTAASVSDWPDKQFRGMCAWNEAYVEKLAAMKFNAMFYPSWLTQNHWRAGNAKSETIIRQLCVYAVACGIDCSAGVEPHFGDSITVSDDAQIERVFKWYEQCLDLGSKIAYLGVDDCGRAEKSFTEADRKAYNNDKLLSQAWYFKKMSDRILKKYPGTLVTCVTSCYETAKGIDGYFNRIGVSPDVVIMWTGEQCVTFDYPDYVIDRYEKGIEGRRYVMFDNTPGQCFGMYRGLRICEKHGEGYSNLSGREKYLGAFTLGAGADEQMGMIRSLQVAELLWNASRHDAEKARQRAIAKIAGNPEAVDPVIRFSEEYIQMALKYPIDKRTPSRKAEDFRIEDEPRIVVGNKKLEDKELSRYSVDDEEYARLGERVSTMDELLKQIEQTSRNPLLTAEFKLFRRNMVEIIDHLHKNNKPLPLVKPEGKFTFNMNDVPGGAHYQKCDNGNVSCAIYGQQTPNNTLEASFQMERLPAEDAFLTIEGQDCDKSIASVKVELNGNKIYEGITPFVQNGWKAKAFPVSTGFFQKGRNVIKIINTCQSSDFIDHWALISAIELSFK